MLPLLRDTRYRSLEAWRGLACLSVVVYHAGFALQRSDLADYGIDSWARLGLVGLLRLMYLGVPIFFVISGYCIAASADAHRRRGVPPATFLKRRFRRIYPPYWGALIALVALTGGLDLAGLSRLHLVKKECHQLVVRSPGFLDASQWLGNLTLTETWRPRVWGSPGEEVFTRVAWSLCHEEQFYLVCFLVLWLAPRRLFSGLALLTAAIVMLRVWGWNSRWIGRMDGTFPMFWHEFAAGLAVYSRLNIACTSLTRRSLELFLATLVAVGMVWGLRSTVGAGMFGLILIALRGWDDRASDFAWVRMLAAFGKRSYSIYLIHLPVCAIGVTGLAEIGIQGFWSRALVTVPLVAVAGTAIGWLFFEVFEVHFLASSPRPPSASRRGVAMVIRSLKIGSVSTTI